MGITGVWFLVEEALHHKLEKRNLGRMNNITGRVEAY